MGWLVKEPTEFKAFASQPFQFGANNSIAHFVYENRNFRRLPTGRKPHPAPDGPILME